VVCGTELPVNGCIDCGTMGAGASSSDRTKALIPVYLAKSPLAVVMSEAGLVQFAECFNVVKIKPETHLRGQNRVSLLGAATEHTGDFYVVAEGSLDVCMKVPIQQGAGATIAEADSLTETSEEKGVRENKQRQASGRESGRKPRMVGATFRGGKGRLTFSRGKAVVPRNVISSKKEGDMLWIPMGDNEKEQETTVSTGPKGATLLWLNREKFEKFTKQRGRSMSRVTSSGSFKSNSDRSVSSFESPDSPSPPAASTASQGNASTRLEDVGLLHTMMDTNVEDFLQKVPFLANISSRQLQVLSKMSQFEVFRPGQQVVTEGAPGDKVFVIIDGDLEVYINRKLTDEEKEAEKRKEKERRKDRSSSNESGVGSLARRFSKTTKEELRGEKPPKAEDDASRAHQRRPSAVGSVRLAIGRMSSHSPDDLPKPVTSKMQLVASIGTGDHFGELSILADIPRQATVRASSVCLLVSISREPFRNLMEQLPEFGNTVQSVMKHYMLSRFFGSLLNEETKKGIDLEEFERVIIPTCTLMEAQAQTDLILENTEAQHFYFLYNGTVKVTKEVDDDSADEPLGGAAATSPTSKSSGSAAGEVVKKEKRKKLIDLGVLGAGNYFGEISILTSTPCRATLHTETNCLLLRVAKEAFVDTWCQVPGLRAQFLVRILGSSCRLEHVLDHAVLRSSFERFVESELASENLVFYYRAHKYVVEWENRTDEENMTEAKFIWDQYLHQNAPEQVNLPEKMREAIRVALENPQAPEEDEDDEEEEDEEGVDERGHGQGDPETASPADDAKASADEVNTEPVKEQFRFPPQDLFHRASNEAFTLIEKGPFSRFKVSEEFSYLLKTVGAYEQIDRSEIKVEEIKGGASELAPPKLLEKDEKKHGRRGRRHSHHTAGPREGGAAGQIQGPGSMPLSPVDPKHRRGTTVF